MTRARLTAVTVLAVAGLLVGANVLRYTLDRSGHTPIVSPTAPATTGVGGSLYELGLSVRDADGVVRSLDDLRGHPVVASMFFASCATVCPLLIRDLKQIEAAAPPELRGDLRVLLVSFDPARDTPAVLADVARRHDVDTRSWRIAVAPDDQTARALAAVLGIRYRVTASGMFDHTTAITVLDQQGEVRGRAEAATAVGAILTRLVTQKPTAAR
jgi:protein SCO1/2